MADTGNILKDQMIDTVNALYGNFFDTSVGQWLDVSEGGPYSKVWDVLYGRDPTIHLDIIFMLICIGTALAIMYFFVSLLDKTTRGELTIEIFFKECFMLIICVALVSSSTKIASSIADLGTKMFEEVSGATYENENSEAEETEQNDRIREIEEASGFQTLQLFIGMINDILIVKIEQILLIVACLSRGVLYILYSIMLPIGISDIYRNGTNSQGMRYLKKLLSISLQAFVIWLIMLSVNLIRASIRETTGAVGGPYVLAMMVVAITLIFRSKQFVDDMVGA